MIPDPFTLLKSSARLCREKIDTIIPLSFIVLLIGIFQLISIEIHSTLLFVSSILSGIVVSYIVYIAMIRAVSNNGSLSLGKLLEDTQQYVVPAVWVSIIMIFVVSGSFLFFILPGFIAVVFLLFSVMSVVVDGKQKHEALIYSWLLVRGRWWSVFWRFVVANIAIGLIGGAIAFILWLFGIGENPFQTIANMNQVGRTVSFGQSVINQVVSNFFIMPMSVAFTYILYKELKSLPQAIISDKEKNFAMSCIRFFTGAGVAFIVVGIFMFGFFLSQFVPNVVNFTHAPAAVFEAF